MKIDKETDKYLNQTLGDLYFIDVFVLYDSNFVYQTNESLLMIKLDSMMN